MDKGSLHRLPWVRRGKGMLVAALILLMVVAAPLYAGSPLDLWHQNLNAVLEVVEQEYKEPVDRELLMRGALKGILQELKDPHSDFLDAKEYAEFVESIQGEFSGIGVHIEKVGEFITVVAPIKGSPADKAGLTSGDRLVAADDVSLVDVTLERAAKLIRGTPGTKVRVKIERPAEGRTFSVEIVRAHINVPIVEHELLPKGIGYIKVFSFSEDAADLVRAALRKLNDLNVRGVILDVRGNPGGYLDSAVAVTGIFVPPGTDVVQVVGRDKKPQVEKAYGAGATVPLAVLTDKGSASASEILAGALQDHGRAVVVGEKTFGKGTVQTLMSVGVGGFIRLTTAEYRTPKGRKVEGQGIQPDVLIPAQGVEPERLRELPFERLLMRGDVGLDVLAVQQRLKDLGYYQGREDGYFGLGLFLAVQDLQRETKQMVNGIVDKPTVAKINEKTAAFAINLRKQDPQKEKAAEILLDRVRAAESR